MAVWDTFISVEPGDLPEDEERVTVIRDLTPGRGKYRSTYARVRLSKDPAKYPETVWIRLAKGQLAEAPCSMEILEFLDPLRKETG